MKMKSSSDFHIHIYPHTGAVHTYTPQEIKIVQLAEGPAMGKAI